MNTIRAPHYICRKKVKLPMTIHRLGGLVHAPMNWITFLCWIFLRVFFLLKKKKCWKKEKKKLNIWNYVINKITLFCRIIIRFNFFFFLLKKKKCWKSEKRKLHIWDYAMNNSCSFNKDFPKYWLSHLAQ